MVLDCKWKMRGAQQDGRRGALRSTRPSSEVLAPVTVKHGPTGKCLCVDLDTSRFGDDPHAVQIHERR